MRVKLTNAEVQHLRTLLSSFRDVLEGYPEVVTNRQEEHLLVAEEIMSEDSSIRH